MGRSLAQHLIIAHRPLVRVLRRPVQDNWPAKYIRSYDDVPTRIVLHCHPSNLALVKSLHTVVQAGHVIAFQIMRHHCHWGVCNFSLPYQTCTQNRLLIITSLGAALLSDRTVKHALQIAKDSPQLENTYTCVHITIEELSDSGTLSAILHWSPM